MEELLLEIIDQPKSIWLVGEMIYTEEPWPLLARRRCTIAEFTRLCLDPFWQTQSLFTNPIAGIFPGDCIELAEGTYELDCDYRLVPANRSLATTEAWPIWSLRATRSPLIF